MDEPRCGSKRARAAIRADETSRTYRLMQVLRRGATGSAVAEVRRVLATLGLLDNTSRRDAGALRRGRRDGGPALPAAPRPVRSTASSAPRPTPRSAAPAGSSATGSWRTTPGALLAGDDVADLQHQLMELGYRLSRVDHLFGIATEQAVRSFQHECGLRVDGICGPATLRALLQLSARRVVGGQPQQLRDIVADRRGRAEAARQAGRDRSGQRRQRPRRRRRRRLRAPT